MPTKFPRARVAAALVVAFVCGLVFASGFDLTRLGWAQTRLASNNTPAITAPASAAATETAFESVVAATRPAVVSITMTRYARSTPNSRRRQQVQPDLPPGIGDLFRQFQAPRQQDGPMEGSGSGFIVSPDGYILTNNHVVEGADKVTVTLLDKRTFDAKVIGRDPTTDVAVVKIDAKNLPTLKLGDDRTAQIGSWALAIGNPFDLNFTVTAGIISAKGRQAPDLVHSQYDITDYIQTDAAINPGNSGGPLLNIKGEVIGINAAIESGTGSYAGYGFAVPITLAKQVMDDILKYGHVERAIIGVTIQPITPELAQAAGMTQIYGTAVGSVTPGGPADKAGIQSADVIIGAAGQRVDDQPTLQRIIRGFHPGDEVKIDIMRPQDGEKHFTVKLGSAPTEQEVASTDDDDNASTAPASDNGTRQFDKLGITVQPVPADFASQNKLSAEARHGLLVTNVSMRGPAYRNLFQGNDVIVSEVYPAKRTINSVSALQDAISSVSPGGVLELIAWDSQQQTTHVVSLRIPK
jgi:serine protease Do